METKAFLKYFFHIHDNLSLQDRRKCHLFQMKFFFRIYIPTFQEYCHWKHWQVGFLYAATAINEAMYWCMCDGLMEPNQRPGLTYKLESHLLLFQSLEITTLAVGVEGLAGRVGAEIIRHLSPIVKWMRTSLTKIFLQRIMTVGNRIRITESMTIIENSFFPAFWPQFIVKTTCGDPIHIHANVLITMTKVS